MDDDRSVDRRQFDDVIRRAAELAAAESDHGEGALAESELIRIAGEVGLSERHVRRALAEVRSGASPVEDDSGLFARVFGVGRVRAGRVVPGTPRVLSGQRRCLLHHDGHFRLRLLGRRRVHKAFDS
jgi:hypothetical protein